MNVFHLSEEANIQCFEPRPAPNPQAGVEGNAVWAIDEAHLPNYLLPRGCPRVCFTVAENTTIEDKEKFFSGVTAARVIALEEKWRARIEASTLYLYEFSTDNFAQIDANAGYYISRIPVVPNSVTKLNNLLSEQEKRNIEIRFLPCLWKLRDSIIDSTMEFSVIRFRNAAVRLENRLSAL